MLVDPQSNFFWVEHHVGAEFDAWELTFLCHFIDGLRRFPDRVRYYVGMDQPRQHCRLLVFLLMLRYTTSIT